MSERRIEVVVGIRVVDEEVTHERGTTEGGTTDGHERKRGTEELVRTSQMVLSH